MWKTFANSHGKGRLYYIRWEWGISGPFNGRQAAWSYLCNTEEELFDV